MKTSRIEQETIINFNQEEDLAELYTASPAVYRRMTKRGFVAERVDSESWIFKMPRQCVKLPSKRPVLSAKQKASLIESGKRLAKCKSVKNKGGNNEN